VEAGITSRPLMLMVIISTPGNSGGVIQSYTDAYLLVE
jgi:hypothetical protein